MNSGRILLHGPISLHGIRSINLPGELARHRSMPARQSVETLSHGHSIPHLTKHISRRQRKSRLANLRRLRPNPYIHCQRSLCQGRFRHQSASRSLRSRPEPLHNSTVFKCVDFRENTCFRSVFATVLQN